MTWEKQKKMISSSWGCLFFLTFLASQKYETDVFAHLDNKVQLQKGRFTFISVAKNFFTVQMGKQRGKISALHMHFSALMAPLGERGGEESVILLLSSLYPPVSLPLKWTTWSPGSVLRVPTGRNQCCNWQHLTVPLVPTTDSYCSSFFPMCYCTILSPWSVAETKLWVPGTLG